MDEKLLYIWLSKIKGIGPVLAHKLIDYFGNIINVYNCSIEELYNIDGIGKKIANIIMDSKDLRESEKVLKKCIDNNIQVITSSCKLYPKQLKHNLKAPIVLYVRGNLKEFSSSVAIVGSRRCSNYGKSITVQLATDLSKKKIPIISGMAKGIDGYAHTVAISNNNYTIAIVGTGVDICYPKEHITLMNKIIENGAMISQFEPGTTNVKSNFIKRNELIAMISDKIVIVEASQGSGSLYTAECGVKYNKEVFAVPGNIDSPYSVGTNRLISCGIKPYLSIDSILDVDENFVKEDKVRNSSILDIITKDGNTLDNIKDKTELLDIDIDEELFKLEADGFIKQVCGLYYSQ